MLNIIKSQNYTLRRSNGTWILIFTMIALPILVIMLTAGGMKISLNEYSSSIYYVTQTAAEISILFVIGSMIFASIIGGGDAGDKTLNYEILSGHSRNKSYFARLISSILWGVIFVSLFNVLPLGYLTLLNGWGNEAEAKNVLLRCLIAIFPIMRMCTFSFMLASVSRSKGKGMALSYIGLMVVTIVLELLNEFTKINTDFVCGLNTLAMLLTPTNSRNVVIDGKPVMVYDTAISSGTITKTIVISLAVSLIYVIIGFINFRKTDRD